MDSQPSRTVHPPRPCPVCRETDARPLFRQDFELFSAESLFDGYDLVLCRNCGAAYANDIPSQKAFDRYYAEMSKYGFDHRDGAINPTDVERFRQTVDFVSNHVQLHESIADVGCATGGLLAEFKRRGYTSLMGYDPSPACVDAARRLYGVEVGETAIHDLDRVIERFDLVILTGVFEHLCDIDSSLRLLTGLLKTGGRIYIEVPDAGRYDQWESAPFQFFSMEHVNYFSPLSLTNLFRRYGFHCIASERAVRHLSPYAVEPAVCALFAYAEEAESMAYDGETEPALLRYIDQSRTMETRIHDVVADLVARQTPLAIWGTGTHTLRLLKTSRLAEANIMAFIDSNTSYQNKSLQGRPIISPRDFKDSSATVVISSHAAQQEIKNQILHDLKWKNPLVCFYENTNQEMSI